MRPITKVFCWLFFCLAMSGALPGADQAFYWNAVNGDFNTSANWTPGALWPGYTGGFWVVANNGTANITADVPDMRYWVLPGSDWTFTSGLNTVGMVNQSAGILNLKARVLVAYNPDSYGVYHMSGGTVNANIGQFSGTAIGAGGRGVMTVSGTATFNALNGITFGAGSNMNVNILNLGATGNPGGTVLASSLYTLSGTGLINFHGGTYKSNFTYHDSLHQSTIYIYGEGATIDTGSYNIGIEDPLRAPTGNGVTGFQLDAAGSGYTGAPIVKIDAAVGDSGVGATALATFDSGTGQLTGLVITNPGTGYTMSPVVTLYGGGGTGGAISIPLASLGASSSGGLTKKGVGTLSLDDNTYLSGISHTYAGPTVVEEGTLFVDGNYVSLSSSGIEVRNAATFSGKGSVYTLPAITVKSGGKLDPGGASDVSFKTSGVTLYDGAKMFIRTALSGPNFIDVQGSVGVGGASGDVRVDFSGTTPSPGSYPIITYTGTHSASLAYLLEYDSVGMSGAQISTTAVANQVTAIFTDLSTANRWSNGAGGVYDAATTGNWTGGVVPLAGNQRAIFADVPAASGDINVSLQTNPTLSSIIFNNPSYSYKIGSAGNYFTLNSTIAFNNLISVIAGTHEINAPVNLNKNTRVQADSTASLTLGGAVGEDASGARVLTLSGPGTVRLSGLNTYTGATIMAGGGVLEVGNVDVVANANALGKSSAAPANLELNGTFRYVGTVNGSTDRGFKVVGPTTIDTPDKNLTISGQVDSTNDPFVYKTGSGTLALTNSGTANYFQNTPIVVQGKMLFNGGAGSVYNSDVSWQVGNVSTAGTDTPVLEIQSGTLNMVHAMYIGSKVSSGATSKMIMSGGKLAGNRLWLAVDHASGPSKAALEMSGNSEISLSGGFYGNGSPDSESTVTLSDYAKVSSASYAYFNGDTSAAKITVLMSGHSEFIVGGYLNCGPWGSSYTGTVANITLQDYAKVSAGVTSYGLYAGVGGDSRVTWTIKDNATLNVRELRVGRIENASGAIYQQGGTFQGTGSGPFAFGGDLDYDAGNATYGYFALVNGDTHAGDCQILVGATGTGVVDQSGGAFDANYSMLIGSKAGATGVYNLTGGNLTTNDWNSIVGYRGEGVLSISGSGKFTHRSGEDAAFYAGYDGGKGIVNLGTSAASGGTLEVYQIARDGATSSGTVNFHGGTLKATASTSTGSSEFLKDTDNYIYGEGAKIDTNGIDVTIAADLKAPTGKGVQSIAFNALTDGGDGYIGAPAVVITPASGDPGIGATAKAVIDPATGKVTGIVVTNPGVGYAVAPTVSLLGGGFTTAATLGAAAIVDNVNTGGLTKNGLGSLTLTGGLSYAGNTAVNAGTLNLSSLNTPAATVSVATGATLNAASIVANAITIGGPPVAAVPEPGTLALLTAAGLLAALFVRRRK
ncbi:MAG: autotransporter-associated beta strand repeat-containing protein [Pirellulales bacterium]|nr:autotransporter-associated beta strand repeat-containing protein [Pirellulales bacterium]